MKIAIPKERREYERRVAATPATVTRYVALGAEVAVESGAGAGAHIPDAEFAAAGDGIAATEAETLSQADIVLKVQRPIEAAEGGPDELALCRRGSILIAMLQPLVHRGQVEAYAAAGVTAFAMELMPRISRAQTMDVLSSQSNLAGYKAVLEATAEYARVLPMLMTAAGTVAPARVFVLGAGVSGLQAIATARRLGAIVSATDVRPVAKEQVESLGAKYIMVDSDDSETAETAGGYAREMSEEFRRRQADLVRQHLKRQDIVICTALVPGRPAPQLISADMVADMKPGAVIVDLAVEAGGNCAHSVAGEVVEVDDVRIIGYLNMPSRIATDASALYARNLLNFVTPMIDAETGDLAIDWTDEVIQGTALTRDGAIINPALTGEEN